MFKWFVNIFKKKVKLKERPNNIYEIKTISEVKK